MFKGAEARNLAADASGGNRQTPTAIAILKVSRAGSLVGNPRIDAFRERMAAEGRHFDLKRVDASTNGNPEVDLVVTSVGTTRGDLARILVECKFDVGVQSAPSTNPKHAGVARILVSDVGDIRDTRFMELEKDARKTGQALMLDFEPSGVEPGTAEVRTFGPREALVTWLEKFGIGPSAGNVLF